jgi:kinesin family member 2/24
MSLSAQKATTNISFFYNLVSEWESSNSVTSSSELFPRPPPTAGGEREGKDVIVAFRTRPPLDREFARFDQEKAAVEVQDGKDDGEEKKELPQVDEKLLKESYRPGISTVSAEPGVMVAHVPGMKVSFSFYTLDPTQCMAVVRSYPHPEEVRRRFSIWSFHL